MVADVKEAYLLILMITKELGQLRQKNRESSAFGRVSLYLLDDDISIKFLG